MFIYVFICSLFAYTVSNRELVVLNDVIVNNELKKYKDDRVDLHFNDIHIYIHANVSTKIERELAT